MLVDGGDDLVREGEMRLFLIPKRVKPLDGFLCRRDDEVRGQASTCSRPSVKAADQAASR